MSLEQPPHICRRCNLAYDPVRDRCPACGEPRESGTERTTVGVRRLAWGAFYVIGVPALFLCFSFLTMGQRNSTSVLLTMGAGLLGAILFLVALWASGKR